MPGVATTVDGWMLPGREAEFEADLATNRNVGFATLRLPPGPDSTALCHGGRERVLVVGAPVRGAHAVPAAARRLTDPLQVE